MSQKAWAQAYSKGSKSLQQRLAKIHANNPEFQDFIKKHGLGSNLSVKQSGIQKKPSVATVKPTSAPSPEKNPNLSREALIKAAAEKIKNRKLANANRAAFGAELGGGFQLPGSGFRRYSESVNETVAANFRKIVPGLGKAQAYNRAKDLDNELDAGILNKSLTRKQRMQKARHIERFARIADGKPAFRKEDIAYKDGHIAMYRGGWIAKRDGKRIGANVPSKEDAARLIDNTQKSLAQKTVDVLKRKKMEIAKGLGRWSMATEAATAAELRSVGRYVDARTVERAKLRKDMAKEKRDRINKTVEYISNPKYSVLDKNHINKLLNGEEK